MQKKRQRREREDCKTDKKYNTVSYHSLYCIAKLITRHSYHIWVLGDLCSFHILYLIYISSEEHALYHVKSRHRFHGNM